MKNVTFDYEREEWLRHIRGISTCPLNRIDDKEIYNVSFVRSYEDFKLNLRFVEGDEYENENMLNPDWVVVKDNPKVVQNNTTTTLITDHVVQHPHYAMCHLAVADVFSPVESSSVDNSYENERSDKFFVKKKKKNNKIYKALRDKNEEDFNAFNWPFFKTVDGHIAVSSRSDVNQLEMYGRLTLDEKLSSFDLKDISYYNVLLRKKKLVRVLKMFYKNSYRINVKLLYFLFFKAYHFYDRFGQDEAMVLFREKVVHVWNAVVFFLQNGVKKFFFKYRFDPEVELVTTLLYERGFFPYYFKNKGMGSVCRSYIYKNKNLDFEEGNGMGNFGVSEHFFLDFVFEHVCAYDKITSLSGVSKRMYKRVKAEELFLFSALELTYNDYMATIIRGVSYCSHVSRYYQNEPEYCLVCAGEYDDMRRDPDFALVRQMLGLWNFYVSDCNLMCLYNFLKKNNLSSDAILSKLDVNKSNIFRHRLSFHFLFFSFRI